MLRKIWQLLRCRRQHRPRLFLVALIEIEGFQPLRLSAPRYELGAWCDQLQRVTLRG